MITPLEAAILDLQPLGESRNDATRLWQMYRTPEEALEAVRAAIDSACRALLFPKINSQQYNDEVYKDEIK